MTPEQIKEAKKDIDAMDQYSMASMYRFSPVGHPYFDRTNGDLADYFKASFASKGGMTSEISKDLGWR